MKKFLLVVLAAFSLFITKVKAAESAASVAGTNYDTLEEALNAAKEGETVTNIIDNPTKEGYDFSGWKLEDNTEFNLETTLVTSNLTVNATFTKKVVVEPGKDEITLNVEDTKDPTKEYSIVIGWYGKTATSGLNVDVMKVFANNLVKYLKAKGVSDENIKKVFEGIYFN